MVRIFKYMQQKLFFVILVYIFVILFILNMWVHQYFISPWWNTNRVGSAIRKNDKQHNFSQCELRQAELNSLKSLFSAEFQKKDCHKTILSPDIIKNPLHTKCMEKWIFSIYGSCSRRRQIQQIKNHEIRTSRSWVINSVICKLLLLVMQHFF